jgi:glucose/arabinose dehydrogenase/PKD repeat protein
MSRCVSAVLVLWAVVFESFFHARSAEALPDGFNEEHFVDVTAPTALDFTPDRRMLVTSKPGRLYVVDGGLKSRALGIRGRVCSNSERGLLGVAVDPDFGKAGHNYVYLYYTFDNFDACSEPVNRVSRFTMSGNTVEPGSEQILLNNIPSPAGNHNGGDVRFGKNKLLYVSVGDGGCDYAGDSGCQGQNDASRDRNIVLGKVLRITRDGGIPASNPYTGIDSGRCNQTGRTASGNNCQETFARGFRNPFRMAFDPDAADTRFRINDVGQDGWEEIDRAQAGADYGWNFCEGSHRNPSRDSTVNCAGDTYTGPIYEYSHGSPGSGCESKAGESITGGAFVPDGFWPASYDRAYLFGDYVCNRIFELTPITGGGFNRELFAGGLGSGGPIAMDFGPYRTADRALYYTTFAGGGEVRRIVHTGGNLAPIAAADTAGANYSSSLTINFDGSESRDPDGDTPLTYVWNFGDGSAPTETTEPTVNHSYPEPGKFTVKLTVRDSIGKESAADAVAVYPGDTPPRPVIVKPAVGTTFSVGQSFAATGSVVDDEDNGDGYAATAPALRWEVRRYHDGNHYHPWSDGASFVAPLPESLYSTDPTENYLQIRLTATDSLGLSRTVSRRLVPRTVDVRFETGPINLKLGVNGYTFRAPKAFTSWEGYELNVAAGRQRDGSGQLWVFDHWSDGRAGAHTIKTPGDPRTYKAYFRRG